MKKIKKDGSAKKLQDFWVFTVYNAYSRRNPFSIYFAQSDDFSLAGQPITQSRQVAILGSFVPAVSYNFKF
jgi:hypothetical protein